MRKYLKRIVSVTFLLVVTIIICRSYHVANRLDDLILDNIEALAQDETDKIVRCYGTGSVDCPITHTKVKLVASGYSLE